MTEIYGTILVVDDNRLNRLKLLRGLENQGHEVTLAENGLKALELLKEQPFDLILLDIVMPEMDGYEVLTQLKGNPDLRPIPVIVISAIDEMSSIIKCIEMGAEDYLPKPFDAVLLKARIGAALEKKRLRDKERLFAKSMERDLEIGRKIQSSFFPESLPQFDAWEIAAHFQAARQVSGDFYDAFPLLDGSAFGFVVADVCDKGVGAALFMGLFRSLIRSFSELYFEMDFFYPPNDPHGDDSGRIKKKRPGQDYNHKRALKIIISHVNRYIASTHSKANMFATLFWGIIEGATGVLSYVNCGHENVVVVGPKGIKTTLGPTGPAVGMLPDMVFEAKCIEINPGEFLVAFTDGVTEARNAGGEFYGEDKLMQLLNFPAESAEDMISRITTSLAAHTAGAEQSDDITLMTIRRS